MYFSHHSIKGPLSEYSVRGGDPSNASVSIAEYTSTQAASANTNPGRPSLLRPVAQATAKQRFLVVDVQFQNLTCSAI
jgi:hypothetical protein